MSEKGETGSLHIGLLSVDRKNLLSPHGDEPGLFEHQYHEYPLIKVESQAKATLGRKGIVTSSLRSLSATEDGKDLGYLLRESQRVNLEEQALQLYTKHDLEMFIGEKEPTDVRGHFLRQIIHWMS